MKEIVNRLHENRQIELAKSILESAGYKVTKSIEESDSDPVQGIGYYGTKVANEFFELQGTDPRVEELVAELGLEDVIWPENEDQPVPDEAYRKVLNAYYAEKSK